MLRAVDPTSGKLLHEFPSLNREEMNEVIEKSTKAFQSWKQTTFKQRADILKAVAESMKEDLENLARYMTEEMGKPRHEAIGEVKKSIWCAEHYAQNAEKYLAPVELESDAANSYVEHPPLGPILGILPWNAPFWLAFRFCAPVLMAGNTCLMKHDPHVPACAEAIAGVFKKSGTPEGVFQNLPLETKDVESAIRHPHIKAVSFTGSSAAGAKVAGIAASEIKPSVLELGGSDPAIVWSDANLDDAADAITLSRIINAGQSCIAAKRIIVEESIHDTFVFKLKERLSALRLGDPGEPSTQIGPLARKDLRDNLARQVDETVAAGAKCLLGGQVPDGDGFFYPVTLLTEVTNDMVACREETFGPVAVVLKAKSLDQAVEIANDTEYGLAASAWTTTVRGKELINKLDAGQVVINGVVKTDPRLPSGGIKKSGLGRELGPHGIKEFVNIKQVWIGPKKDK